MRSLLEHSRRPDIVFCPSGRIDIGARAARQLRLRRGDVIDLAEEEGELYLYVRCRRPAGGRYEATVFPTNRRGFHFRTYSRALCASVLAMCGTDGAARLSTGEPELDAAYGTMLPVITRILL